MLKTITSASLLSLSLFTAMDDEFQDDWEVLQHSSDCESVPTNSFDEIDSTGLIHADYFSLDSVKRYGHDLDDSKSVVSDNPSWIDPGLEENPTRYLNKESTDFWSDSSSDRSEDRNKFADFLVRNEVDFHMSQKRQVGLQGIREIGDGEEDKAVELGNLSSDSSITAVGSAESGIVGDSKLQAEDDEIGSANEVVEERGDEIDHRKSVVWWKMPMEFLKYFVFRMSPVWTVSVAAAFMGFVILGRRLYKMKKKTRGLQIKVAVDDKKVSQVMSRAARLNEAFSVVKHVPVIRPSLPAIGVTTWPAMAIR